MYDLLVNAFLTLNEPLKKIHFDLEFLCINNIVIVSKSNSFVTPWTVDHQAPLFMGFPRQEYWHGLPFPFPGDLLNLGIKHVSPALAFFTTEPPGKPINNIIYKPYYMLYCSISAIIRFGLNIPVTKPHYNKTVYSKKKFFFFCGGNFWDSLRTFF